VPAMAKAALAAGADGLLIEVHVAPEQALCDGRQALRPAAFTTLMAELRRMAPMVGKRWVRAESRTGSIPVDRRAAAANGLLDDEVITP